MYFVYLFNLVKSRASPRDMQLAPKKEQRETDQQPSAADHNIRDPPPSASRCAQVPGYESPLQKRHGKGKRKGDQFGPLGVTLSSAS
jgi:hypothetical protein